MFQRYIRFSYSWSKIKCLVIRLCLVLLLSQNVAFSNTELKKIMISIGCAADTKAFESMQMKLRRWQFWMWFTASCTAQASAAQMVFRFSFQSRFGCFDHGHSFIWSCMFRWECKRISMIPCFEWTMLHSKWPFHPEFDALTRGLYSIGFVIAVY